MKWKQHKTNYKATISLYIMTIRIVQFKFTVLKKRQKKKGHGGPSFRNIRFDRYGLVITIRFIYVPFSVVSRTMYVPPLR